MALFPQLSCYTSIRRLSEPFRRGDGSVKDVGISERAVCFGEGAREGGGQELVQDRASRGSSAQPRGTGAGQGRGPCPTSGSVVPGRAEPRHREGLGAGQVNPAGCVKLHG